MDSLDTRRLRLLAGTALLHAAELERTEGLGPLLGAEIPDDWPPAGTDYDRDAIGFFLKTLTEHPERLGWLSFYVVTRAAAAEPARLVANAGYFGPPDERGAVEIGYSVAAPFRRQGFASEAVEALVANAFAGGASRVIAHTRPDNVASIALLARCGFRPTEATERPDMLGFERLAHGG